jgi:UPF0271 protein
MLCYVTSANVACGFHAGDPAVMRRTVRLALENGVSVGAHPGLPDRAGFGRREISVSPDEAFEMTLYQIGALEGFVRSGGGRLSHVKPHGALYNMAARDGTLARAVACAVHAFDPDLILYGLSGSALISEGNRLGLRTAAEAFADRRYARDGSLLSRRLPGSVITDVREAESQALLLVREGRAVTPDGEAVLVQAETLCIHGDTPDAVAFARAIRSALDRAGVAVRPLG